MKQQDMKTDLLQNISYKKSIILDTKCIILEITLKFLEKDHKIKLFFMIRNDHKIKKS